MEVIEFLGRTDQRNLKLKIQSMVDKRLQELEQNLEKRKEKLRFILQCENLQYNEELAFYLQERIRENSEKRVEWIGLKKVERELAEEEFKKSKERQRAIENCEEMRHWQSKQNILEVKRAQLYQIEEKKLLRQRQKQIDEMWQKTIDKLENEKELQRIHQKKLLKIIENTNQGINLNFVDEIKHRSKTEKESLQYELEEDNLRALCFDKAYKERAKILTEEKKLYQKRLLEQQILANQENLELERIDKKAEEISNMDKLRNQLRKDLEKAGIEKIRNREWHKKYLAYTLKEKEDKKQKDEDFERKLFGTGCVLQQRLKTPYNRNAR